MEKTTTATDACPEDTPLITCSWKAGSRRAGLHPTGLWAYRIGRCRPLGTLSRATLYVRLLLPSSSPRTEPIWRDDDSSDWTREPEKRDVRGVDRKLDVANDTEITWSGGKKDRENSGVNNAQVVKSNGGESMLATSFSLSSCGRTLEIRDVRKEWNYSQFWIRMKGPVTHDSVKREPNWLQIEERKSKWISQRLPIRRTSLLSLTEKFHSRLIYCPFCFGQREVVAREFPVSSRLPSPIKSVRLSSSFRSGRVVYHFMFNIFVMFPQSGWTPHLFDFSECLLDFGGREWGNDSTQRGGGERGSLSHLHWFFLVIHPLFHLYSLFLLNRPAIGVEIHVHALYSFRDVMCKNSW